MDQTAAGLGVAPDPRSLQIRQYSPLRFQPHGDLPTLAAVFLKPQRVLLAGALEVLKPHLGDRPSATSRKGWGQKDRPVPQAQDAYDFLGLLPLGCISQRQPDQEQPLAPVPARRTQMVVPLTSQSTGRCRRARLDGVELVAGNVRDEEL